jgi:NOL1/NOP2/sun family putative RNA methylase
MELPEKYQQEMKALLKEEWNDYCTSLDQPCYHALHVNTLKISVPAFLSSFPYDLSPVPWCPTSFYYQQDGITTDPYDYAGLYYVQEPSASLPASVLPVQPGDRVLDLCAAPGGKSTQLAAKLQGQGVLVANDISVSRAQILLRALERAGVKNSIVTSCEPAKLAERFTGWFDRILVDAPCSGEGMFRKDPAMRTSWCEKGPDYYAPLQKEILSCAVKMLRPGGKLVYSTCTFSIKEDEEVIQDVLSRFPDLHVVPIPFVEGFVQNAYGTKLFPHHVKGEGHFVCLLKKDGPEQRKTENTEVALFEKDGMHISADHARLKKIKDKVLLEPDLDIDLHGIRVLRSGLLLGEDKGKHFVFSQPMSMAMKQEDADNCLCLNRDDERVLRYLKGETIEVHDQDLKPGWCLVCVGQYPLGFGKVTGHTLKNKLPASWVMH